MKQTLLATLFVLLFCFKANAHTHHHSHHHHRSNNHHHTAHVQRSRSLMSGVASYYTHGFKTASGQRFNKWRLTAASQTLPLGTILQVTNVKNKCSTVVLINDRGPYVRGRIIDLSLGAAHNLQMIHNGLTHVRLAVVGFHSLKHKHRTYIAMEN